MKRLLTISGCFLILLALIVAVKIKDVKDVSEWSDILRLVCSCGNKIYVEPADLNHYKVVCQRCDKVLEKSWAVWQKEIDKWEYVK